MTSVLDSPVHRGQHAPSSLTTLLDGQFNTGQAFFIQLDLPFCKQSIESFQMFVSKISLNNFPLQTTWSASKVHQNSFTSTNILCVPVTSCCYKGRANKSSNNLSHGKMPSVLKGVETLLPLCQLSRCFTNRM